MWKCLIFAVFALALSAADDGWGKVKSMPSGTELRVTKIGVRFGIVAKLYDVTDESVIVTTKSEQLSITKEQIAKIEYLPPPSARNPRAPTRNGKPYYELLWSRPKAD